MITYEEYKARFGNKVQKEVFDMLNTKERFAGVLEDYYGSILFHPILVGISSTLMERTVKDKDKELEARLHAYKEIADKFAGVVEKYKGKDYGGTDRYDKMKPSREEQVIFSEYANKKVIDRVEGELEDCHDFYEAVNTDLGQELLTLILSEKGKVFEELYENKNSNGICTYLDIVELLKGAWQLKIRRYENAATNLRLENIRINNRRKEYAKTEG
jgi:hypothetical protein